MSAPEELHVAGGELSPVAEAMATLTTEQRGWINLTPAGEEPARPQSVWGGISGRGPDVPRVTWMAPVEKRSGTSPAQLGIEQPTGKALARLAEAGHPLPPGWTRVQDHPMRGLVVALPPGESHTAVVRWALEAVEQLTGFRADGGWRAQVYSG